MPKKLVDISFQEAKLKRKVRAHLKALGYRKGPKGELIAADLSKDGIRKLHSKQREAKIDNAHEFINKKFDQVIRYFACGREINPEQITPRLEVVYSDSWQSDLFRMASLTWSIPVSQGYGRRMRFLVWDDSNEKLIGIFALGDPVFNLRVRDNYIGWDVENRTKRLVNIMDAFVLGAVPPYNFLLGGKLVAALIRSIEVQQLFEEKYKDKSGIISKTNKNPHLAVVTTSSALGRSSIYNRLKLGSRQYFKSIGYTEGWGHFHIPNDLFNELREYLFKENHPYATANQYGDGPNWRLRTAKAAFEKLGLNPDLLKHGVSREVFLCELASNVKEYLSGVDNRLNFDGLENVARISDLAKERWILSRARSKPEYINWRNSDIISNLFPDRAIAIIDEVR